MKREVEDKVLQDKIEKSIKELKDLIELRYQRKQKTKVDFLLEIKNMHAQMKIYNEKVKENQNLNEVLVEIFHYVKIIELEVAKVNHQVKIKEQLQLAAANTVGSPVGRNAQAVLIDNSPF